MGFEVGQRISDYEILAELGAGGMGRVYRVRNVISDRMEAMKVLLPDLAAEPELASRFISEIRTLASFDHPNIAQLHTAFQYENQLVMIMEFVEGYTLDQRAKQPGGIPLDDVLGYTMQVLSALSYAHGNGVIHRDIKPANMMVTPHGIVKLMDFGIAKSTAEPNMTRPGVTIGSLYYMSPEQVRGGSIDARSDLYSVGISLYELTAGRRPFQADSTYGILNQQLNVAPQPPIELNPALPPALNDVILTALAKEPMHRFQSADAFRNALQNVRAGVNAGHVPTVSATPGQPLSAPPIPPPVTAQPSTHRGLYMTLGALAVVLVVALGAIALPHWMKTRAAGGAPATVVSQPGGSSSPALADTSASGTQGATSQPAPPPSTSSQPLPPAGEQNTSPQQQDPSSTGSTRAGNTMERLSPQHVSPQHISQQYSANTSPAANTLGNPPQAAVQQPAGNAQPATPAGPSAEEMDRLNDRMVQLSARARAAKSSIDHMREQQAASGYQMRGDITASLDRMESYMGAADHALQDSNVRTATRSLDQAEKEIDRLEAFLGR